MPQDFKRIGYVSRARYVYLVLCMIIQPLLVGYLLLTKGYRKTAKKPAVAVQSVGFMVVLCMIVWGHIGWRFYSVYSIPDIISQSYERVSQEDGAAAEAKEFLKNTGLGIFECDKIDGQVAIYLKNELDEAATLLAVGVAEETYWETTHAAQNNRFFTPIEADIWLFAINQEANKNNKKSYAIVSCFQWDKERVLQESNFMIRLGDGMEMDGGRAVGSLRLWAERGQRSYFVDEAFGNVIGYNINSFPLYGKSSWKKYSYRGCAVTYILASEMPEDVTITLSQESSRFYGNEAMIYSQKYRFQ